nr:MAG TPA: hypothetical protein [Caudoviricetes sp.]
MTSMLLCQLGFLYLFLIILVKNMIQHLTF